MNHFNSSFSPKSVTSNTLLKWTLRAKISITMTNGGGYTWGKAIRVKQKEVEIVYQYAYKKYEETPSKLNLRNFLIIRLPRKVGLRTSEIRTVTIELIDFQGRSFMVLDSKKHTLFPMPLDILTLHFIKELIGSRHRGYVFIHEGTWNKVKKGQPLTKAQIWNIVHDLAEEAGVSGFNPRNLRQAFAYEWYRKISDNKKHSRKTMKGLQIMMRHSEIKTTGMYVDQMFCFEDLQKEFDDDINVSFEETTVCNDCDSREFCKFAPLPSCVSDCHGKQTTRELMDGFRKQLPKKEELKI